MLALHVLDLYRIHTDRQTWNEQQSAGVNLSERVEARPGPPVLESLVAPPPSQLLCYTDSQCSGGSPELRGRCSRLPEPTRRRGSSGLQRRAPRPVWLRAAGQLWAARPSSCVRSVTARVPGRESERGGWTSVGADCQVSVVPAVALLKCHLCVFHNFLKADCLLF